MALRKLEREGWRPHLFTHYIQELVSGICLHVLFKIH